jgi:hypothetical protein
MNFLQRRVDHLQVFLIPFTQRDTHTVAKNLFIDQRAFDGVVLAFRFGQKSCSAERHLRLPSRRPASRSG